MASKFYERIKTRKTEGEVQEDFNKELEKHFGVQVYRDNNCDGLLIKDNLKMLIEYKYDERMKNPIDRAKVLIQVIFYLKDFETNGETIPNVIFIGDINEVFVLHSDCLMKYTKENDIDWNYTHSNAWQKYPKLVKKISEDSEINPYIFDINEDFDFKEVITEIEKQCKKSGHLVKITEHNIDTIFADFKKKVLTDSKLSPEEYVSIFIGCITDKTHYYKHPEENNILIANTKQVKINSNNFNAFFSHFKKEYNPNEKNIFTAISDRLMEDDKRRRSGVYYTPTIFADYAHKMLCENFGENWREKYVVWDCCWGTGNLTRDYQFNELYASTIISEDLNCGINYNTNSVKFQFDFLDENITDILGWNNKIPLGLREALQNNKPFLFLINPPYATPSNAGANGTSKSGCSDNMTKKAMKEQKLGKACEQLYCNFLYKIIQVIKQFSLTNVKLCLFSPALFLSGNFSKFRKMFYEYFRFQQAIQFCASHFYGTANNWSITLSIWDNKTEDRFEFPTDLVEVDNESNHIYKITTKYIYNTDNKKSASDWIKSDKKHTDKKETICLSSAVKYSEKIKKMNTDTITCLANDGNNVDGNPQGVYMINTPITRHVCICEVSDDNFDKAVTLFVARRIIKKDWTNWYQEYLKPNTEQSLWNTFVSDSIVYSIFESKSLQTSLCDIGYMGKTWKIINEFFFMSKNKIMELANQQGYDFTYNEARTAKERYVYTRLQNTELSAEAKAVLDKAIELTEKSFECRDIFNQEHPEFQIMNWDCGWYQIKQLLNTYFKDDLKEFNTLYKILSDKMRPMVYELGFLKK